MVELEKKQQKLQNKLCLHMYIYIYYIIDSNNNDD